MPNNYVLLETIALTQSATSVTFDNLPTSGYTDLKIVVSARGTTSQINAVLQATFNGSSAANYSWRQIQGNSSVATSSSDSSIGFIRCGYVPDLATTSNTFSSQEIYIPNFLSSSSKSVSIESTQENNSGAAGESLLHLIAGRWGLTNAISSISFALAAGNFVAGSTFSLYGIAAYGTTPVLAPKATGGNIVANDGTYWYHAFTSSGYFVPQVGLTADVLVVAGGGGGGASLGAGGGAGGVQYLTSTALTQTSYPMTIGAGGNGGPAGAYQNGSSGNNSSFSSIVSAIAGGAGVSGAITATGIAGGSGGGSAGNGNTGTGGAATAGTGGTFYGNAGGNTSSATGGAGGGGAGSAGSNQSGNGGANGGAGLNTWSSWLSPTSLGVSGFIAGGGGGGCNSGYTPGAAGSGGATAGTAGQNNCSDAVSNTGSGGGGGGNVQNVGGATGKGGNGGSGIIIVRYPIAS